MNATYTSIQWWVEVLPVNCSQPPLPLLFFNRNTVPLSLDSLLSLFVQPYAEYDLGISLIYRIWIYLSIRFATCSKWTLHLNKNVHKPNIRSLLKSFLTPTKIQTLIFKNSRYLQKPSSTQLTDVNIMWYIASEFRTDQAYPHSLTV